MHEYRHFTQFTTNNRQQTGMEGSSMEWKTWQVYCLGKKKKLRLDLSESREVSSERKVKVIPCGGTEDGKGVGTNSRKSDMRVIFV